MNKKKKKSSKKIAAISKTAKRKGGGSKLARTEIVQVRLDPKLRFAAELASRKHRRTLSSFIEWCVSESIHKVWMDPKEMDSAYSAMSKLWSTSEIERFINLATEFPHLLTHEEEMLFDLMEELRIHWISKGDHDAGYFLGTHPKEIDTSFLGKFFNAFKDSNKGQLDELKLICLLERAKTKENKTFQFPGKDFDFDEFDFTEKELNALGEYYGA